MMVQPELKMVDEMRAACIFNKGAVGAIGDDMGRLIGELMEWVMKEGLQIAGPHSRSITAAQKKWREAKYNLR